MNYRKDKYGNELSALGFGCMRFEKKLGRIEFEKAEKQILTAVENGVNYFDTAFIYPGSESALGEILEKNNLRDKVYIATKLPPQMMLNIATLDRLFNEQLKRLRTDRIDYYFIHMLADINAWNRIKSMGIEKWIEEKKQSGKIGQIGFSYHGDTDGYCKMIDAYNWDFSMIQYNYMDEHTQAGRRGLQYAHEKGITVMIMEPLRGGKLVKDLPEEAKKIFADYKTKYTPAQWAFRWLWNQKEITTVLSGMNSEEMVLDNIATACAAKIGDLTAEDEEMLRRVGKAINASMKVGCTGCGYCMPCPKNIDIRSVFGMYNTYYSGKKFKAKSEYIKATVSKKTSAPASDCIACGKCETHCPQSIEIRKEIKAAANALEGKRYKLLKR
ncbi:MAG: aldo/keto reductase [Clostridia bacterium]|nr:aldo/keto reductase [Clostridia bacterium]